jgi:signal transduction histidine kinase
MDRRRFVLALAALAAGLAIASVMLSNDVRTARVTDVILVLGVGWSFVASGLVAWQLYPSNPIGPVMVATGLLRFAAALAWSQAPLLFSIGSSFEPAYLVGLAYVLLAFPGGRLVAGIERVLFAVVVVAGGPLHVAWQMSGQQHHEGCAACPDYVFQVVDAEPVARAFELTHEALGVVAGFLVVGVLLRRWRRASEPLRFAIAPILWVGAAGVVAVLFWMITALTQERLARAAQVTMELMLVLVPMAFLVGVARTRLARTAVADLVIDMGGVSEPTALRDSLARALHDPSLEIAYWIDGAGRYVDAGGQPVDLPLDVESRAVTMIERAGRRIAALVHDPAVRLDEHLVESVSAAAALQIDNERLQADLRARLEEVAASRARIVESAMTERRRIERDLHDGAQQRLVSVAMSLGLAESKVTVEPEVALGFVREAKGRLADALAELRDLSQGIHPGILTERGLPAALAELAQTLDMPVDLEVTLPGRLPERVEEAAYFVVSEALTNIVKHAHATRACVQVEHREGDAVIRVSDDGVGGVDVTRGSGLRGLRDRVEALDGRLAVACPPAGGTEVEARIPCGS